MNEEPRDLELTGAELERALATTSAFLAAHIDALPTAPMHRTKGSKKAARALREAMPEQGAPLEKLLKHLFERVIPASLNTASGGYLAYVPGGGVLASVLGEVIALGTNRFVGVSIAAPLLTRLEQDVIDWIGGICRLPEQTRGGVLTSGGSIATLTAVVAARRSRVGDEVHRGVIYTSDQAHHSVKKAALIAGFPLASVRVIPTDERFAMRLDIAAGAIAKDRENGLIPCAIVAAAGTTNTGAIDDLEGAADLAKEHNLWLHVDAAYGGFFAMTERGARALKGLERADSITLDPHKSLFLPYGTGCLVVRERASLARAFSETADYMPVRDDEGELVDFCDVSAELSREARGLRVWLPLKLHGADAFRRTLDHKLDLATYLRDELKKRPRIEIVAEPQLSLLAFRIRGEGDAPTRAALKSINARQRVFLTGTLAHGQFVIRACILSFRTKRHHVDALLEDLDRALG
jgi:aromatic-L-amino-acid decarboxylase